MVRETSYAAYCEIRDKGLLSERRFQVYEQLYLHGPCTTNELFHRSTLKLPSNSNVNISARLGELRDMGVVTEIRQRPCSITGMLVIEWGVTDKLPQKFKPTKKNTVRWLKNRVAELEAENAELRRQILVPGSQMSWIDVRDEYK